MKLLAPNFPTFISHIKFWFTLFSFTNTLQEGLPQAAVKKDAATHYTYILRTCSAFSVVFYAGVIDLLQKLLRYNLNCNKHFRSMKSKMSLLVIVIFAGNNLNKIPNS